MPNRLRRRRALWDGVYPWSIIGPPTRNRNDSRGPKWRSRIQPRSPDVVDLGRCHAAVVMSHHLSSDLAYLRVLGAARRPAYVGLLGPAARRRRIADELGPATEDLSTRLRGPVGLDIGASTPESIALAIVTEVHAWLADRAVARPQQIDSRPCRKRRPFDPIA